MYKNFTLNLSVKANGTIDSVFNELKNLQKMEIADVDATITFNGIKLPAGYYDNF